MAKEIFCAYGVDVDAVAGWIGSYGGADSPDDISRGLFAGEVASPRLLKLFERYGLRTTWFIPGHSIETGILPSSTKRGEEPWVERVERLAEQALGLAPERAQVRYDGRPPGAIAQHVDAAPRAEREAERREHAVHEADAEDPRAGAAVRLGPVIAEQDAAERAH